MIHYSNEQLATVVALPTITLLLIWTIVIFHKNRKKWGPYDIPIVSVLVLSVIRNITILSYSLLLILATRDFFNLEYCSAIVWIFNSIHTFQASSLTTIAIIGLFSVKLYSKQQSLRQFLTPTHIIYHLFCLTTLCACVGVAAILAQTDRESLFEILSPVFEAGPCKFMPFNLDVKYNVFILVLHLFLAVISLFSFLVICFTFYKVKNDGFDYLKKSSSDLSDISLGNTMEGNNKPKPYYDTYIVQRGQQLEQNNYCGNRDINWNSDLSNLSTTVSSTNSRKPCLGKGLREREENAGEDDEGRTGLETIHPVLIVCYLFYHLPLIVLCIYPKLIHPWPVAGIALWLGLVQDLLIPIGLGIVDSRFCKWVKNVYKCSRSHQEEKLPHVGLNGKFRPFGTTSQPQSLEVQNHHQDRSKVFQAIEHRFPITNGSLYTSIDGRLPVIHNYRRNKDPRGQRQHQERQSSNVALHSSHVNRQDFDNKYQSCNNCELDLCPSHSNLHHLAPNYINRQLTVLQQDQNNRHNRSDLLMLSRNDLAQFEGKFHQLGRKVLPDRPSLSQDSLNVIRDDSRSYFCKNFGSGKHLNRMRLSRSEDSLNDLQVRELANIPRPKPIRAASKIKLDLHHSNYSSSDEDYLTDINETIKNNNRNNDNEDNCDSSSSRSCFSITTEANGDFEFFQSNDKISSNVEEQSRQDGQFFVINNVNNRPVMTSFKPINGYQAEVDRNCRINRSNSKRSLDNLQAFVEVEQFDLKNNNNVIRPVLQRSNSYMEDKCSNSRNIKKLLRADSKLSDCSHQFNNFRQKIKSVEYLPSSNSSTIFIEDFNEWYQGRGDKLRIGDKGARSVPDLKKVFISEYI